MNTGRWWAPTAPHLGPDEVDLAMLAVTGENRRLDLGGVLLAAHRVGEAACLSAAREPICDRSTLVNSLAKARIELAEPMMDSVSKCVSEKGAYGALLVRDVLDAADEAAVGIFTAAVQKGVAGSLAAARAGAVYGVPAQELGRYRALAADPKAVPASLTDVADRALFGYFEKVAAEETDQEVSKATATATLDPRPVKRAPATQHTAVSQEGRPYYDVRDAHGLWARSPGTAQQPVDLTQPGLLARMRSRYGISGTQAPDVATGRPSETATTAEAPPKPITVAELRRKQQILNRPRRRSRAQTQPAEQRATRERASRKRKNRQRRQRQEQLQQHVHESPRLREAKPKKAPKPVEFTSHHLLDTFAVQPEQYTTLTDEPVAYALSMSDGFYFNQEAASSPGRLFRVGHLEKLANAPDLYDPLGEYDSTHEHTLAKLADAAEGKEPQEHRVTAEQIVDSRMTPEEYLENERISWDATHGDGTGRLTSRLPAADDSGDYIVFTEDEGDITPEVFEYVIQDARAIPPMTEKHPEYKLDPNQAYQLPERRDGARWQRTYDAQNHVIRNRLYVTRIDEPEVVQYRRGDHPTQVKKDVAVATRPTTVLGTTPSGRHYYNQRDAHGEWAVRPGLLARVQSAAPQSDTKQLSREELQRRRKVLARSKQRRRKAPQKAAQQLELQRVERTQQTRTRRQRRRLTPHQRANEELYNKINSQIENQSPLRQVPIDPNHDFRILDVEDLLDLQADNGGRARPVHLANGIIPIRSSKSLNELDAHNIKGRDLRPALREAFFDLHDAAAAPETKIVEHDIYDTLDKKARFAQSAHNRINSGAHGIVVEVPGETHPDERSLHLSDPPETLALVEFDESASRNGPYDLVPVGEFFHRDRTDVSDEHYTAGMTHHMNMRIQRYLAVGPEFTFGSKPEGG